MTKDEYTDIICRMSPEQKQALKIHAVACCLVIDADAGSAPISDILDAAIAAEEYRSWWPHAKLHISLGDKT